MVTGTVGGFVVRVQFLVVFVCFVVVLSHSADLFTCHDDRRSVTLLGSANTALRDAVETTFVFTIPNDLLIHLNRERRVLVTGSSLLKGAAPATDVQSRHSVSLLASRNVSRRALNIKPRTLRWARRWKHKTMLNITEQARTKSTYTLQLKRGSNGYIVVSAPLPGYTIKNGVDAVRVAATTKYTSRRAGRCGLRLG